MHSTIDQHSLIHPDIDLTTNQRKSSAAMATRALHSLLPLLLAASLLLLLITPPSLASDDAQKRCERRCQGIPERQDRRQCERRCMDHYGREKEGEVEKEATGGHNPYYFGQESYEHWTRTPHGQFKVLQRFSERSDLLLGIEGYRVAVLEAEPETFIMPSHMDAEEVFYVMEGHGTIMLIHGESKDSYNIKRGDVMSIPAGAIVYAVNKASNERLRIAMLLQPISTPGHFEEFFGAAGRNPQSFYTSFSTDVLEAAFNLPRDRLERVFGQQRKGEIIKATKEQIKAMTQSTSEGAGAGQTNQPFNLLQKQPSYANNYGKLYQVNAEDYEELQDLDIDVSVANISQRSMMAPNYNSRATKLILVMGGSGYFEMVCPHISRKSQRTSKRGYHMVRSQVSRGSLFVVPAGHPVVAVASSDENLEVLVFGVRVEGNMKHFLAGRNNVLNKMEREAKEMSFGVPGAEVEGVMGAQRESVFLPGPEQRRERERSLEQRVIESMLSFAGF